MIELARVIRDLRDELEAAIAAGDRHDLRFELGTIELEASIAIEMDARAEAKARFWVVDLGAEGGVDRTATQRIKLTLSPRLSRDGSTPLVSGPVELHER